PVGLVESLTDLRCQLGVAPDDHLSLRYRDDRDQEQHAIDALLDAVAAAGLGARPAETHAAAAVNFNFCDGLELLWIIWDGCSSHGHYFRMRKRPSESGLSCTSFCHDEGIAAKPTLLRLP